MPGMLRRCLGAIATSALVLVLGACGGGSDDDAAATTSTTAAADASSTTDGPAAPPVTQTAITSQLGDLSLVAVPRGYELRPDGVGGTGPYDLERAVGSDEASRQVLTDDGFQGGYQRLWINEQGNQLIIFLFQFADEAGAADYASRNEGKGGPPGATPFDVPEVPGATAISGSDDNGTGAIIVFSTGPYAAQVLSLNRPGGNVVVIQQATADLAAQLYAVLNR